MTNNASSTSAAYVILSMLLVLAGFALSMGGGLQSSEPAAVYLFFFGNPALWTAVFILGLRWYGRAALWLLLGVPFAFYGVPLFLLVMY